MNISIAITKLSEQVLTIPFSIVLLISIIISFKTRFVQIRMIPKMLKLFFKKPKKNDKNTETIESRKALFTAISTSIGIGNIVGPIIAIKMGGPGALLGFIIAMFFGAATTFTEVSLALKYRKKLPGGGFAGGPMQYIARFISPVFAKIYSFSLALMLLAWSAGQANTFADIMKPFKVPTYATGLFIAIFALIYLIGGIKKIGDLSSKIVPIMFIIFCSVSLWIILLNIEKLPAIISMIFKSALTPKALSGASLGLILRWGIARGIHTSESGVGTATIPHSMSKTDNPTNQGILAMISVWSVLFVCILSGLVVMITGTWQDPSIPLGINMLAKSFSIYTPGIIGNIVLIVSTFLFAIGSVIGNSFNGGQGYLYLTKNRWLNFYYFAMAIILFLGSIFPVKFVWSAMDFFLAPVVIINIFSVLFLLFKKKELFKGV